MDIEKKRVLAVFDFDGTITTSDTLPIFILFISSKVKFFIGGFLVLPYLILFKLKLIANNIAKEKLFSIFFSGFDINEFDSVTKKFITKIDDLVNPDALDKIKWHQNQGHEVIILSASAENWIRPWANKNGIETVLATKLQVINGKITGNFLTKNCHGPEKVSRLLEKYPNRSNYILFAYGDSNGDKELLSFADHKFYRKFN